MLAEPGRLRIWNRITHPVSSELIRVEALRTVDRARIQLQLEAEDVAEQRASVLEALEAFDIARIGEPVLERATEPFPTTLGTLDAIHLSTALLLREDIPDLELATHDADLATAARAVGFRVHGAPSRTRARGTARPRSGERRH